MTESFSRGSCPDTRTVPELTNSCPVMIRIRVDLPAPLRPSRPVMVSVCSAVDTSSSVVMPR
jgi:hypothetical protein